MNELALFAGAGGGILGGHLLGWRTVCAVEFAAYPRRVLLARQRDGMLPRFPIWDDVRTFDGKPWRGRIDVVSGGFPCTDISPAGKGAGIEGTESGLWKEMARIICEVHPRFVFVENSAALVNRGLGTVLGDLASLGFDAEWGVLSAAATGAPHQRERIWIAAHAKEEPWVHEPNSKERTTRLSYNRNPWVCGAWDEAAPKLCRVDDGVGNRVDSTGAIGNGQVPIVVATAWRILTHNA
jgi:DNA (cytosine-5)-methyltransferase 1